MLICCIATRGRGLLCFAVRTTACCDLKTRTTTRCCRELETAVNHLVVRWRLPQAAAAASTADIAPAASATVAISAGAAVVAAV